MVYPGAFITRAGLCDTSKERISPYLQLKIHRDIVLQKEERHNELGANLHRLQARDIELLKSKEMLSLQASQVTEESTQFQAELQAADRRMQELSLQEKNDETLLIECRKRTEELRVYEQRLKKDAARKDGKLSEAEQKDLQNLQRAADELKQKLRT